MGQRGCGAWGGEAKGRGIPLCSGSLVSFPDLVVARSLQCPRAFICRPRGALRQQSQGAGGAWLGPLLYYYWLVATRKEENVDLVNAFPPAGMRWGAFGQYHQPGGKRKGATRARRVHPGGMKDGSRGSKRGETPGWAAMWVCIPEGCQKATCCMRPGFWHPVPGCWPFWL